jgi:hypothetical protein
MPIWNVKCNFINRRFTHHNGTQQV